MVLAYPPQDDMSQRQGQLLAAMDDAEARQRRQQEAAAAAWGAALNASRQLEARQARYEQLQVGWVAARRWAWAAASA